MNDALIPLKEKIKDYKIRIYSINSDLIYTPAKRTLLI